MEQHKMFFLFLILGQSIQEVSTTEECNNTDVVFLLDKSNTITNTDWDQIKNFATFLATELGINENGNLAGAVAFAEQKDYETFYCDETNTLQSFNEKVLAFSRQNNLLTDIVNALRTGFDVLNMRGCGRPMTQKIMVLISDGKANRPTTSSFRELYDEAASIRNSGVFIYALGLKSTDESFNHLIEITDGNAFRVTGISQLSLELARRVSASVCPGTSTTAAPPPTTTTSTTTSPSTTTTTTTPQTTTATTRPPATTSTTTTPPPTTSTTTTTPTTTTSTTTTPQPTTSTTTPPSTTTTSTTTTVPPQTTTTTPATTITTTTDPTTTTESTTKPPPTTTTRKIVTEPEPNITVTCSCDWNLDRFLCFEWTKYEIIRNFTGTCFKDKLEKAIAELTLQINQLQGYINITITCRRQVRNFIEFGVVVDTNTEFDLYEKCTIMGKCRLTQLRHILQKRLVDLQDMLDFEKKQFGFLDISGFKSFWYPHRDISKKLLW